MKIKFKTISFSFLVAFVFFSMQIFSQRTETSMNKNWRFILDDKTSFSAKDYNHNSWENLNIPHDWSFENGIRKKGNQGQGGGYHDGGIGWYRKDFTITKEMLSSTTYISFDGVYMNSEVWINGHFLGRRPYGYISFRYDISKFINEGKNTIAVRVDNSLEPSARWYHPCGIYAPVTLVQVNPLHIVPNSVSVTTAEISKTKTAVNLELKLQTQSKLLKKVQIKSSVISNQGKVLHTVTKDIKDVLKLISLQLNVDSPKLWSPETPTLYVLVNQIIVNGKVVDEVKTTFGFRTVDWKKETGFWLNGENIKLKGVCEHWEGGPVGGAWTKPMLRWKLQLLKNMGINAIRPSHNPNPPMFYDLCDEIGLLVMDEIFDGWHQKAANDYGKQAFDEWWQRDITEWITRDRNHPSVFVYSLGNETESHIAPELVAFCNQLDPTRLVTSGSGNTNDMQVAGVNGGSETKSFIEGKRFDKPFISTEAPHTWQTRGYYRTQTWWRDGQLKNTYPLPNLADKEVFFYEWDNPKKWNNKKQHFNSSYDNATVRISARKNWELVRDNPWYSGNFRWTGFDYYGEAGLAHGGWPFNLFMGGTLDVAGFEKDLYYFYQSQWTKKPMLHILPSWTHPKIKKGTLIPVWVYSNVDEVELFLNGRSLGKDKPGKIWNEMQCDWMIPYEEGKLEAVGYVNGKEVKREIVNTASELSKLKNTVQQLEAEAGFNTAYIVTTEGIDTNGNLTPYADNKVYYAIAGDIEKIALENGSPVDSTNRAKANYRSMFMGKNRAFFQAKDNSKKASVVVGSILGDSSLYTTNTISIVANEINLQGKSSNELLQIFYTINGDDPSKEGIAYQTPFTVVEGRTVKAIVKQNNKILFDMEETFGKNNGLFWGNEHSEDMWKNRGINIAAETAKLEGGAEVSSNANRYKGEGFVVFNHKEGAISWYQENDGDEGNYKLRFRYMHNDDSSKHPMILIVNDVVIKTINFEPTGGWVKEWDFADADVKLKAGANNIQLKTTGQSGPYIDEMYIE